MKHFEGFRKSFVILQPNRYEIIKFSCFNLQRTLKSDMIFMIGTEG